MRNILLICVAVAALHADSGKLVAKVLPKKTEGYLVFSDGTFWNVTAFVTRWRNPLEWVSGKEIYVPREYQCQTIEWSIGDEYEIFDKVDDLRLHENDASNAIALQKHRFLMVNRRTGNVFFASEMQADNFVSSIYDLGYAVGYDEGYQVGYEAGFDSGEAKALK